jgi:RNA polymerase sigma factor (TIGR02999 family)
MGTTQLSAVQVTRILRDWTAGDSSALERLTPIVYAELHRIASRSMAQEREGHLLQPSALVNDAFVRLIASEPLEWADRAHFFAHSARLMRRVLADFARAQNAQKRGCGQRSELDLSGIHELTPVKSKPVEFLDLNAALDELAELSPRQVEVVELRYFGGLEIPEVAAVLGVSEPTVVRDWRVARAWLLDRLRPPSAAT